MARAKSERHYLFNFKVNLKGAKGIWRSIAVRGDQTLDDLHEAIFNAFDRDDPHLYSFYFPKAPGRGTRRGPPPTEYTAPQMFEDPMPFGDEDRLDASAARLDDLLLEQGQRFEYLFDFGDCWMHEILVEAIEPAAPRGRYPRIVESRGESPPQYENADE
jgi:hypothetical protein